MLFKTKIKQIWINPILNIIKRSRMGTFEKLLERFLARPKDFTYDELKKLLRKLGYSESTKGKTSGSRVAFIDQKTKNIIRVHKPHPGNILKEYIIKEVIKSLQDQEKI